MLNRLRNYYYRQSLTAQIILLIILVFSTFFIIQLMLNRTFFPSFYRQRELNSNEAVFLQYVEELESITDQRYFDLQFAYATDFNMTSILLDSDFRFIRSTPNRLTIRILNQNNESYTVEVNDYFNINENETVVGVITPLPEENYIFTSLFLNDETLISGPCFDECISINGRVTSVNVPNNLNYLFRTYPRIQREQARLSEEFLNAHTHRSGWRFPSTDGPLNIMVYVYPLGDNYVMAVFPIEDTDAIVAILALYQNIVYASALLVILLWSFRIGKVASEPIRNVESVAREISKLNFDAEAIEFKSKEATSLSKSINQISRNLRSALTTLNQNNQELMELYREQSDQVDLKKRLVSSISHELKTPLMIIQVTIQGILDGIVPEGDVDKEFNTIMQEINKSTLMIQDLLQIYRLDSKETELKWEQVNLSQMALGLGREFNALIKKFKFTYIESIEENVIIKADSHLMQRVLSNFMTNAIKYTPIEETIAIDVFKKQQNVHVELTNYGVSIPENQINNLWTPFYRLDERPVDQDALKGSGIGLYLVSEVLKAHHFDFGIENIPGGVKAYIRIPMT